MSNMDIYTFGELLNTFRKQHRISQNELADKLDVHRNTIGRWERGIGLPESKTVVLELAKQLHLNEQETRQLLEASLTTVSPYWLIPYQRNPFFTGRDSVLQQLHDALAQERAAVLSQSYALSGLGGIGKTQTAIEYAYRYANEYAAVFWISAETNESIVSSFVAIAELLNLPEKQEKEQSRVIAAVTHWLTSHSDWLVIFDNVEDLELVKGALPPARCGSLLFTSRRQALGFAAQTLDVEQMTPEEGIRFLLHRARLLDPAASLDSLAPEVIALAREIVVVMDGLPLALDQAGAYIEETQCELTTFFSLIQISSLELLKQRESYADHPQSVVTTFTLSFYKLQQKNITAANMLTLCAFLAADNIPIEIFVMWIFQSNALSSSQTYLRLNEAIKDIVSFSLINYFSQERSFSIHRLVQAVIREQFDKDAQYCWIKDALCLMGVCFPTVEFGTWKQCEGLLPHALACIKQLYTIRPMEKRSTDCALFLNVASLQCKVADYFADHARYDEAANLYRQSLHIREEILGADHLDVAHSLNNLGEVCREQGIYVEAEPYYQRALHIREKLFGQEHPELLAPLNNLGLLYVAQGHYKEAVLLYERVLRIIKYGKEPQHLHLDYILNNLALVCWVLAKYTEAETYLLQALYIREKALGAEHLKVVYPLAILANVYMEQERYSEAEMLYQRALHILEATFERGHPQLSFVLYSYAHFFLEQGQFLEAESLYKRALLSIEQTVGSEHDEVVQPLRGLAKLHIAQRRWDQAETYYQQALHIQVQRLRKEHPEIALTLCGLAELHQECQRYTDAQQLYIQAIPILERTYDPEHPLLVKAREKYSFLIQRNSMHM